MSWRVKRNENPILNRSDYAGGWETSLRASGGQEECGLKLGLEEGWKGDDAYQKGCRESRVGFGWVLNEE